MALSTLVYVESDFDSETQTLKQWRSERRTERHRGMFAFLRWWR